MSVNLNIDVKNETEFNQQIQMYLSQGYSLQSNLNETAILKKKSYSIGLLIILILLFFPLAIIYYLVASDDIITIKNTNSSTDEKTTSYCSKCGQALFEDSKFCPKCGEDLTIPNEEEE